MKSQKVFLFVGYLLFASMAFVLSPSTAMAGEEECDPKKEVCPTPCDPKEEECDICHNIGGPNGLGANCDAGNCDSIFATGNPTLIAAYVAALEECDDDATCEDNIYGGIVIPFNDSKFAAHDNHGDGPVLVTFPRIHATQPHVSANVGCFAVRDNEDPGN
jgi:hypothetical protein